MNASVPASSTPVHAVLPEQKWSARPWQLALLPQTVQIYLMSALMLFGIVPVWQEQWAWMWWLCAALLLGLLLVDALVLGWRIRRYPLAIERQVSPNIALGVSTPVALSLSWGQSELPNAKPSAFKGRFEAGWRVWVHDWHPTQTQAPQAAQGSVLAKGVRYQMNYRVTAHERGTAEFTGTEVHYFSGLGLWRWRKWYAVRQSVRVLPNFSRIAHYRLLATANRLSDLGILRVQKRGLGTEFDHLRDYRVGDSLRQIHWAASSAQNRLIAKEYQAERDQQVILMLDVSQRMWHKDSGESLLDEALNSALLLAHVAANQGDAVGMMTLGAGESTALRWSAPRKGTHAVSHLMNQFFDITVQPQAVDYLAAAQYLLARHKKRSLIVLMTNTRNDDYADLSVALKLLRQKHLVILADIRERALTDSVMKSVQNLEQAVTFHAGYDYLNQRWRAHAQLRHQGVLVQDVLAVELPVCLVSQYWQLKEHEQF